MNTCNYFNQLSFNKMKWCIINNIKYAIDCIFLNSGKKRIKNIQKYIQSVHSSILRINYGIYPNLIVVPLFS